MAADGLVLTHRGATLAVLLVYQWAAGVNTSRDGETAVLSIAFADPGDYMLCDAMTTTAAGCAAGLLAAGTGPLTLQLLPNK